MKNYTDLSIICDRSGSMASIAKDMEGGIKSFLEQEAKSEDVTHVSYYRFDDRYETVFENKDIKEADAITVLPRGGTALLDAIGRTMQAKGQYYASLPESERPNRVLFLIITDGQENSSKEYTFADIKEKIKHQRETYSWDFVFLGTTQDALFQQDSLGIMKSASKGFDRNPQSIMNTFADFTKGYGGYKTLDRTNVQTRAMSYSFDESNDVVNQVKVEDKVETEA